MTPPTRDAREGCRARALGDARQAVLPDGVLLDGAFPVRRARALLRTLRAAVLPGPLQVLQAGGSRERGGARRGGREADPRSVRRGRRRASTTRPSLAVARRHGGSRGTRSWSSRPTTARRSTSTATAPVTATTSSATRGRTCRCSCRSAAAGRAARAGDRPRRGSRADALRARGRSGARGDLGVVYHGH